MDQNQKRWCHSTHGNRPQGTYSHAREVLLANTCETCPFSVESFLVQFRDKMYNFFCLPQRQFPRTTRATQLRVHQPEVDQGPLWRMAKFNKTVSCHKCVFSCLVCKTFWSETKTRIQGESNWMEVVRWNCSLVFASRASERHCLTCSWTSARERWLFSGLKRPRISGKQFRGHSETKKNPQLQWIITTVGMTGESNIFTLVENWTRNHQSGQKADHANSHSWL